MGVLEADLRSWYRSFWLTVRQGPYVDELREAALAGRLKDWTRTLTKVAAQACESLGLQVAALGHGCLALPVPREEYFDVDLLAFPKAGKPKWLRPVLALELENRKKIDAIAYSLWKVCLLRVSWGGVFCYRAKPEQIKDLVEKLTEEVMKEIAPEHDILLVVGTRSSKENFPDGFFQPYVWNAEYRSFQRL